MEVCNDADVQIARLICVPPVRGQGNLQSRREESPVSIGQHAG